MARYLKLSGSKREQAILPSKPAPLPLQAGPVSDRQRGGCAPRLLHPEQPVTSDPFLAPSAPPPLPSFGDGLGSSWGSLALRVCSPLHSWSQFFKSLLDLNTLLPESFQQLPIILRSKVRVAKRRGQRHTETLPTLGGSLLSHDRPFLFSLGAAATLPSSQPGWPVAGAPSTFSSQLSRRCLGESSWSTALPPSTPCPGVS